ncbi:MAG: TadE/TadG family type IV pilus assembly protein [Nocardioides sp.]
MRTPPSRAADERGAAVVDFVLVLVVLVPLFLGILQVALVLHVRNTLTAAASEGARYAAAADRPLEAGAVRTRQQIAGALAERFAQDVVAVPATVRGAPGVEVRVVAEVPPLGLWGPAVRLVATGHAVEEVPPDGP